MEDDLVARATVEIEAVADDVWDALTDPAAIREYMFGSEVETDWRAGSQITWRGEFAGKPYEDRGQLLEVAPGKLLKYTHHSGGPDTPLHLVSVLLTSDGATTSVSLTQDGNADTGARRESEKNWTQMLAGLKQVVERRVAGAR